MSINMATQIKWTNFLKDINKLPKLIQDEIDDLNIPLSIKGIEQID